MSSILTRFLGPTRINRGRYIVSGSEQEGSVKELVRSISPCRKTLQDAQSFFDMLERFTGKIIVFYRESEIQGEIVNLTVNFPGTRNRRLMSVKVSRRLGHEQEIPMQKDIIKHVLLTLTGTISILAVKSANGKTWNVVSKDYSQEEVKPESIQQLFWDEQWYPQGHLLEIDNKAIRLGKNNYLKIFRVTPLADRLRVYSRFGSISFVPTDGELADLGLDNLNEQKIFKFLNENPKILGRIIVSRLESTIADIGGLTSFFTIRGGLITKFKFEQDRVKVDVLDPGFNMARQLNEKGFSVIITPGPDQVGLSEVDIQVFTHGVLFRHFSCTLREDTNYSYEDNIKIIMLEIIRRIEKGKKGLRFIDTVKDITIPLPDTEAPVYVSPKKSKREY